MLRQAIFLDMFGDPRTNPKRWPYLSVSDYVAEFQGGKSIEPADENTVTVNRILKVGAVTWMKYQPDQSKPVPDTYRPAVEHFVRGGVDSVRQARAVR
jgi:type I restriction enzyme S subunit